MHSNSNALLYLIQGLEKITASNVPIIIVWSCCCVDQEQGKIDQLTIDKKELVTQLQCCEEELKRANECEM